MEREVMTGGYMQGVTKKGIDLVSRVTGILNQLTAEDFEDTYVWLRVILMEADSEREVGFWSNEYDYGNWAFFDGPRSNFTAPKPKVELDELVKAIDSERPNNRTADDSDTFNMALAVMNLLKEKKIV